MKPVKFYNIQFYIRELEFDGDESDLRLHYYINVRWFTEDQNEYEATEKAINDFSIKRKHYTVYTWCDVSGFDYWIKDMQEENYIQISIAFNSVDIPYHAIRQLRKDLETAYSKFENYESYAPMEQ